MPPIQSNAYDTTLSACPEQYLHQDELLKYDVLIQTDGTNHRFALRKMMSVKSVCMSYVYVQRRSGTCE